MLRLIGLGAILPRKPFPATTWRCASVAVSLSMCIGVSGAHAMAGDGRESPSGQGQIHSPDGARAAVARGTYKPDSSVSGRYACKRPVQDRHATESGLKPPFHWRQYLSLFTMSSVSRGSMRVWYPTRVLLRTCVGCRAPPHPSFNHSASLHKTQQREEYSCDEQRRRNDIPSRVRCTGGQRSVGAWARWIGNSPGNTRTRTGWQL